MYTPYTHRSAPAAGSRDWQSPCWHARPLRHRCWANRGSAGLGKRPRSCGRRAGRGRRPCRDPGDGARRRAVSRRSASAAPPAAPGELKPPGRSSSRVGMSPAAGRPGGGRDPSGRAGAGQEQGHSSGRRQPAGLWPFKALWCGARGVPGPLRAGPAPPPTP